MVMVSHTYQFVFLKTRKTAGTSVEMALQPLCTPPGQPVVEKTGVIRSRHGIVGRRFVKGTPLDRLMFWRQDWYNHMPARDVRKALGAGIWDSYRKIATVRNPFDLAVSRYHFNRSRANLPEETDFAETRRNFHDMVQTLNIDCDYDIVHLGQSFVCDEVIRFETLREDTQRLAARLAPGTPPPELPHTKNTTSRRKHSVAEYFDEASIARIRKTAAWVFERFDYADKPGA